MHSTIFCLDTVIILLEIQERHWNTEDAHLICTLKEDCKKGNEVLHFFERLEINLVSKVPDTSCIFSI